MNELSKESLKRERYITQAELCESANRWALASIMWRKAGKFKEADACEIILQAIANNPNFVLEDKRLIRIKID